MMIPVSLYQTLMDNNLVLPTAFVFLVGVNKYAKRTRALYLTSLENLKKSIFQSSTSGPESSGPDETSEDPMIADQFFRTFKGLVVDIMTSYAERSFSWNFFLKRTVNMMFKLISIELSLMYAVFYTEFLPVSSRWGMCTRTTFFCSSITVLVLFFLSYKGDFYNIDIGVNYTLLVGVIVLDMDSAIILLQSEWVNPVFSNWGMCGTLQTIFLALLGLIIAIMEMPLCFCGAGSVLDEPWSETIDAFNLLDYCLKESRRRSEGDKLKRAYFVAERFSLKEFIDQLRYMSQNNHNSRLWDYIFDELHDKALPIDDPGKAKEVSQAKGGFTLRKSNQEKLMHYEMDFEYDEEIFAWHVAMEICYHIAEEENDNKRRFCKVSSDYMLYLLVMQQKITSAIADIGPIRFRDSCSEARALWKISKMKDVKELCVKILEETTCHKSAHDAKERGK